MWTNCKQTLFSDNILSTNSNILYFTKNFQKQKSHLTLSYSVSFRLQSLWHKITERNWRIQVPISRCCFCLISPKLSSKMLFGVDVLRMASSAMTLRSRRVVAGRETAMNAVHSRCTTLCSRQVFRGVREGEWNKLFCRDQGRSG